MKKGQNPAAKKTAELALLLAAAGLYFHFQFLTDCAALAAEHAAATVRRRLLFWRTAQAVTQTASVLLLHLLPGLGAWGTAGVVVLPVWSEPAVL